MYIDFQELKSEVGVQAVADMLALKLTAHDEGLRGPCPRCKSGGDRALVVTPGKGYYCFADHKGGDSIALAAHVLNVPMKDAALKIADFFGLLSQQKAAKEPAEQAPHQTVLEPLDYLLFEHEAVQALGLPPATAEALGIGYAKKGIMRGRVAIPLRTPDGTLTGYCGYSAKTEPRLKLPPTFFLD
ncbi:MAG: hypothetical protein KDE45_00155 [Caldilineaceae bacterium]|nr:hypothetical protein [Caldilineaceae bacterium]